MVYNSIFLSHASNKKQIGVLIDPDKSKIKKLTSIIELSQELKIDYFLIGGSHITESVMKKTIKFIKKESQIPIVLFPGSTYQLNNNADALLLLSLISGRNPELLIGKHVEAAPYIKASDLEVISTGYMLVDGGNKTSVQYISNTKPIPYEKSDIAMSTALAGSLLGNKLIFMDAGSGAKFPVSGKMIKKVKRILDIPLIVGGGIKNPKALKKIFKSGADMAVIGSIIEKKHDILYDLCEVRNSFNANLV